MRSPKWIHMHNNNSSSSSDHSIHVVLYLCCCSTRLLAQYFVDEENNRNFQQNFSLLCNPNKRRTHFSIKFTFRCFLFVFPVIGGRSTMVCWHCFVLNRSEFQIGHVMSLNFKIQQNSLRCTTEIIYLILFALL